MEQKEVLCYGDSNTWGCIPRWEESDLPSERYDAHTRWPRAAAELLGPDYHIIEEGLGGRTTIYDRPDEPGRNGEAYLLPCLLSHRPLDLVVLMLGTNDLHRGIQPDRTRLGDGIRRLVGMVQSTPKCGRGNRPPRVLLLAPIPICPSAPDGRTLVYDKFLGDQGRALSLAFPKVYCQIAGETGCWFLNAADYAQASPADGIHFTLESHPRLGRGVAQAIREIMNSGNDRP